MKQKKILTTILFLLVCCSIVLPFANSEHADIKPYEKNRINNQINSEWRQIYDSDFFLEIQSLD